MKALYVIMIFLFIGCSYTRTYTDRESDKAEAEIIGDKFYAFLKKSEFNEAIGLFSNSHNLSGKMLAGLNKNENALGKVLEVTLKESSSQILESKSAMRGEYILIYDVKRTKTHSRENFKLTSNSDGIVKITYYNVAPL